MIEKTDCTRSQSPAAVPVPEGRCHSGELGSGALSDVEPANSYVDCRHSCDCFGMMSSGKRSESYAEIWVMTE
jgi:hypothetical protein